MIAGNGFAPMNNAEMTELIHLKGWKNRAALAANLRLTENAVQRWFMTGHAPDGPASILMRVWLDEARAAAKMRRKVVAV